MQVILLENIKKLGTIGQKVEVNDGYARNFLIKNKKALLASKKNIEYFEKQKSEINKKNEIEKEKAKEISKSINNIELEIFKEAMDNGQLYGSINIKEIVSLIKNQKNVEISAEKIEIKGQIKSTGTFKVFVNLHAEVQATVSLNIKPKVE
jgi:large subunit ribosomal protein L9